MGPPKTATSGRMYAQSSEKKMSHARIGFALLCGLAVCCSVMYITADAGEVYVHEEITSNLFGGSKKMVDAGTSVGSTDVLKAGQIYTETPDGRMRLMDYFNNVEKEISDEVANRKADIASVRAQMARDFAFNAAARAKLKKDMLHKMAVYAAKAKKELDDAMERTQKHFARMAALENKRYQSTLKRDKTTLKIAADDKKEAAHNLRVAVTAWQKATNSWAASTNARIDTMNKHVAANAAQIKENAKKARKDLENAMHSWDQKIANFRRDAKAGRSKLAASFAAQDKAQRAWANNKIKTLVANTAAQFNDVENKMAKNRHEVDIAIMHAAKRFAAALNAAKALEDKRYAQTVANIAAAKKEAIDRVSAAKKEFKVRILQLSSVVKEQVTKVNNRIDQTAAVVRSDAAAQAKVNSNVNAELARMIKLGNKRYAQHLKNDAELRRLIAKDKAETDAKMDKMAEAFNAALAGVRKQLAKDRAHAEHALKKATSGVWAALWKNQRMQAKKNGDMAAATRRMKLDAMDAVRKTKALFIKKIKKLGKKVAKNDQIADKKIDKDVRTIINYKLSAEITKLRSETNASVEALALQSKEARAEMKKEMLYAIRSASQVAKADLNQAVLIANKKFVAFEKKASASHAKSALERKAIKAQAVAAGKSISRMLTDAVATVNRAQLAYADETAKAIKKSNTAVDAHARQMEANAKKVAAEIKAQTATVQKKIAEHVKQSAANIEGFSAKDKARAAASRKFLTTQLAEAEKASAAKFGAAYVKLAKDRRYASQKLGAAVAGLNDSLAKQAALADSRFAKTVKDLGAARSQAAAQVKQLRKDFSTQLAGVTAFTKKVESRLVGEIAVATGEVISLKANQLRVNRRVSADLKRIVRVSDSRFSSSKRARGKLKLLMDENKAAASAEVAALATSLKTKLAHARARNNRNRIEMAKDLTQATKAVYEKMASVQKAQMAASGALSAATSAAATATSNSLKRAKKMFATKIGMLTNVVAANAKRAERDLTALTGVVHNIAKANAADRSLIRAQTAAMEADLNKAVTRAIQIGEAKAKAVEQRIAAHLKSSKRFLQVELSNQCESAADNVFKIISGKRQKIADNYLSFKAYAVSAVDKVTDYTAKGKGRNLSSIGDLMMTVGALASVKAPKAEGLGVGGKILPPVFSGKNIKVKGAVAKINGLVNEYATSAAQVRARWPMGLGKYLLDKLQVSMEGKGVLQVDKVSGKAGNFVYVNGRSVGLSNKLNDFATLASRMSVYEAVLAKLTSRLTVGPKTAAKKFAAKPPEWQGN